MPEPTTVPSRRASTRSRFGDSCAFISATDMHRSPGATAIRTARHASRSSSVAQAEMSMTQE